MLLKEVPVSERPREKLINSGSESLTNIELIAILLRTGSHDKNVLSVAKEVVYLLDDITDLPSLTLQELMKIKGIGKSKAISILASVELGKRIALGKKTNLSFTSPEDVFSYFYPRVKDLKQEVLFVVYLDVRGKTISIKKLTEGTVNSTLIDPKLIFKWAYKVSSQTMILVHNHPSGDSTPSLADIKITSEVVKQAKVIQFTILDHIIIGDDFYSMKRNCKNYKIFN